jgi:Ser/Thr protein kinase RdoA (MazF antagonist)
MHNDLHPHNFFVRDVEGQPQITIIDLDVGNRHWFATDIATALYPLAIRRVQPPDKGVSHRAFVQRAYDMLMAGYEEENALDRFWLAQLPHFLKYCTGQ